MMLAAFEEVPTVLALLGILVLWFTFKRLGRRRTKSSNPHPVSQPASNPSLADGHLLDAPASVARWEVTMHETARDLMGRLDSKIVIVEQLVRDAGQVAARLDAMLLRIEQTKGRPERTESDAAAGSPAADTPPPADCANVADP